MSDALTRIGDLARLMVRQQQEVREVEAALKEAKANLLRTSREDLPELMREFGLEELKLADGSVVSIKDDISAKIPEARELEAYSWLTEHGYGGIIKSNVSVSFARSEHDLAVGLELELQRKFGDRAALEEKIHPQTLLAFLRERIEAGEVVPYDLFGVVPFSIAKLKEK